MVNLGSSAVDFAGRASLSFAHHLLACRRILNLDDYRNLESLVVYHDMGGGDVDSGGGGGGGGASGAPDSSQEGGIWIAPPIPAFNPPPGIAGHGFRPTPAQVSLVCRTVWVGSEASKTRDEVAVSCLELNKIKFRGLEATRGFNLSHLSTHYGRSWIADVTEALSTAGTEAATAYVESIIETLYQEMDDYASGISVSSSSSSSSIIAGESGERGASWKEEQLTMLRTAGSRRVEKIKVKQHLNTQFFAVLTPASSPWPGFTRHYNEALKMVHKTLFGPTAVSVFREFAVQKNACTTDGSPKHNAHAACVEYMHQQYIAGTKSNCLSVCLCDDPGHSSFFVPGYGSSPVHLDAQDNGGTPESASEMQHSKEDDWGAGIVVPEALEEMSDDNGEDDQEEQDDDECDNSGAAVINPPHHKHRAAASSQTQEDRHDDENSEDDNDDDGNGNKNSNAADDDLQHNQDQEKAESPSKKRAKLADNEGADIDDLVKATYFMNASSKTMVAQDARSIILQLGGEYTPGESVDNLRQIVVELTREAKERQDSKGSTTRARGRGGSKV